jgi:hypothetical protein
VVHKVWGIVEVTVRCPGPIEYGYFDLHRYKLTVHRILTKFGKCWVVENREGGNHPNPLR